MSEHLDILKVALQHMEVIIGYTNPSIARYDDTPRGDPPEETDGERWARYICYWNEFKPLLSPIQLKSIRLGYCRRPFVPYWSWEWVGRKAKTENPEEIAETGLLIIEGRIIALLRNAPKSG